MATPDEGSDHLDEPGRRDFLKLLGATAALAGCERRAAEHLPPETLVAGKTLRYATSITLGGVGTPLLVTARDGRPVKVDGHPEHPLVRGGSGPIEQAELLRLYDPQRARALKRNGQPTSLRELFDEVSALVKKLSAKDGGRGVRFFTEPSGSPLLGTLKARILEQLPNARFVAWSPLAPQARYDGARLAFGRPLEPLYDLDKARVVASFDHDFLSPLGANLGAARGWANRRTPGPDMARLYAVEPSLTLTGASADHRLRVKGTEVEVVLRGLAAAVARMRPALKPLAANAPKLDATRDKWVTALARDLVAAGREALVTVGDRQPPVVHALAHALTAELGALGHCVQLVSPAHAEPNVGPQPLKALADELASGSVDLLVVTAPNPAYSTYTNIDLAGLMKRSKTLYLGPYEDETAAVSQWFVPQRHALEAWGDARALDGSVLLQQPLVEPLHPDALSEAQLFAAFVGEGERKPLDVLEESWARRQGVDAGDPVQRATFSLAFAGWVQAGAVPNSASPFETPPIDLNAIAAVPPGTPIAGLELALARDAKVHDGRFANCAWLQELPDPITKLVWDNAALISPATAKKLGLDVGVPGEASWSSGAPRVRLTVTGPRGWAGTLEAPVFALPGHADDSITLPLGYGREGAGEQVAHGVGVSAYALRHSQQPWFCAVEVAPVAGRHPLVTTQQHGKMEGRELALETAVAELPGVRERLAHLNGPQPTLLPVLEATPGVYRWGMAIDLNRCTGCSACVTACQAENNIPVVGKDGVHQNREMFWLRVDRYFTGSLDEPESVLSQPVTCQHCENAPCEHVCPVSATTHGDEGVNTVAYHRCIGARHCSNNCPYQVRRFNHLDYQRDLKPIERLASNPHVTVRGQRVMEKCTFCVQRIERARVEAAGRKLADGAVVTACQQACPTQAITFGSLHDARTEVSKKHADPRRYELLHGLGTRPKNAYLVKVRNPNPELA
ncbi:MAG: 4Fe-4S dicluster domain-containing protein [Myxococcaceae bacterium]|nr:4Fe-4S dicluster domain-containing protein [Myxococcaceae bacterium]